MMNKDKNLVRHKDMIDCATKGIEGRDIETWRIESIKSSAVDAHTMITRKHGKIDIFLI